MMQGLQDIESTSDMMWRKQELERDRIRAQYRNSARRDQAHRSNELRRNFLARKRR